MMRSVTLVFLLSLVSIGDILAFSPTHSLSRHYQVALSAASDGSGTDDIVAKRIKLTGDVNGGYYRACVLNEASRFRRLVGTMTPPEEGSKEAEIYVEGKKKMVESFIRWCQRGNVGLSQVITVDHIEEEDPTGLYDDFYLKTK
mmetsp:Transcript_19708/g.29172  ORF Transcript_19708/g.29172 Transcript_19708/m.29172 type:complete len:144 (-) Transcript_19708:414-845(-)|eukprot:CAMPEP_0194047706 /NCGR_PEP_ID=MMETSP0009_2-20130614/25214_1 /TAXON_ID=210454 /ORGANISM="Grammatophora oceanica, Strain CCMP 410" /LENGTH=143 /DNA_ID=CAMNT_0038693391 /DNA_START=98 /DNA_END=529 /DNA_ORIENTATION=-